MASSTIATGTSPARRGGLVSVDGRTYPLLSARLEARAEGGIASTKFTQTYGNPYQETLEVFYVLPLPASGAVIGYTIRLGSKEIHGEIRRRAEAREDYRKALLEGRTAALLEQERADTFTQQLGSLPPGTEAEIDITILQPLAFLPAGGREPARWEYRFPTVAGVRYQGSEGRVPDARALEANRAGGTGLPVRLEAALYIADGDSGKTSPLAPDRQVSLEDRDGGVRVVLKEAMRLDRDLVIRWHASEPAVGVRVIEGRGLSCDPGRYALITLTPPASPSRGISRDLTLLLDASGSMDGIPLERAKTVAEELLRSLEPGDRFELMAFATGVERLVKGPVDVGERSLTQAWTALAKLRAGGATEMTRALVEALKPLRPGSQRQVILISDGYIGFEGEVVGEILRRLAPGARLHTVGIGAAPNRTLTRGAARAGRGVEILVGCDEDARAAALRLSQATIKPILTEIEVEGPAISSVAPGRPQDVFAGQPLVLLAELSPAGGTFAIRGKQAGAPELWERRIEVAPAGRKGTLKDTTLPIGALFGREAIEDLELQVAAAQAGGCLEGLEMQIETLGLRHGIASRKTSLIAVSEDLSVDPKDPRRREQLAVELPAEVSAEGVGLATATSVHLLSSPSSRRLSRAVSPGPFVADRADFSSEKFGEPAELDSDFHRLWEYGETQAEEPAAPETLALEIYNGRVLRLDDAVLIFEFEVPVHGFRLPADGTPVRVDFDDGFSGEAWVLAGKSSPEGPYEAGLTVRLALQLEDTQNWHHREARISWFGPQGEQVDLYMFVE